MWWLSNGVTHLPMPAEPFHDRFGGGGVGGERNLMHVANPHQGGDVRLVGLGGQGITKEDHCLDFPFRDPAANDQIAAGWAVSDAFDVKRELIVQQAAGVARRHELAAGEVFAMGSHEIEQIRLLGIVSNESDHGFAWGAGGDERRSGIPESSRSFRCQH